MKKRSICAAVAAAMSAVMIMLPPMQVMAAETNPVTAAEYISEVRIGVGKTMEEAEQSLQGYTILKNGDSNADLNEKAGGGMGSQGERVVLLGYKTTTDRSDAVTDLAVMNMKGGYDVKEYEALMEKQMKEQIIPFVESFKAAIEEYRENYDSDIEANNTRFHHCFTIKHAPGRKDRIRGHTAAINPDCPNGAEDGGFRHGAARRNPQRIQYRYGSG